MKKLDRSDLRGIVTITMLVIFAASIFIPVFIKVFTEVDIEIPASLEQAVITLTTAIVTFYFSNKATKDNMDKEKEDAGA